VTVDPISVPESGSLCFSRLCESSLHPKGLFLRKGGLGEVNIGRKVSDYGSHLHADTFGIVTFTDSSPLRPNDQRNDMQSKLSGGPP
jgi:hypothetical protein